MDYREFTESDLKWIRSLGRVMKKAPGNLFMFIGSGSMIIYSRRYMNESGSVDTYAPSTNIPSPIEMDGGDW